MTPLDTDTPVPHFAHCHEGILAQLHRLSDLRALLPPAAHEEQAFLHLAERILSRNSHHMAALGLSLHMRLMRLPISHM